MKRMTQLTIAAVLLGTVLLLAGCGELDRSRKGGQITFTTATGEVGTKTTYGGDDSSSGTTYQYILWEEDDEIRIVSDNATSSSGFHYADYAIDELKGNSGHQSYATIAPTPNGLTWGEEQDYNFYAVTPKPGVGAVNYIYCEDTRPNPDIAYNPAMLGTVSCTLPYSPTAPTSTTEKTVTNNGTTYTYTVYPPDMRYAVMTAANENFDNSTADEVSLLFKPAFTAFEINLTSADENFTVTKLELVSDATGDLLTGSYTLTAGGSLDDIQTGSGYNYVSMTMSQALTTASGLTVTFFTIPKKNTGMISLKVTTDKGTATLNLTKANSTDPYIFDAGKKYRFNLLKLGETWKIFFDVAVDDWVELPQTTLTI